MVNAQPGFDFFWVGDASHMTDKHDEKSDKPDNTSLPAGSQDSDVLKREFSSRLSDLLVEKRLSQAELATKSRISTSKISDYVRGKFMPSADSLIELADALEVRPQWLVFGRGTKTETVMSMSQNLTSDGLNNQALVTDNRKAFDIGSFASRLRDLIFPEKIPVFAARAGLPASLVTKLLSAPTGVLPNAEVLIRLRQATGATTDWLVAGIGEAPHDDHDVIRVPLYDVHFAGGSGTKIEDEKSIGDVPFDRASLLSLGFPGADGLGVVMLKGDSMAPQIADGARVLLDFKDTKLREDIFAFRIGDDLRIKRLRPVGIGDIEIISTNPIYPSEIFPHDKRQHFQIIGRAVWAGTRL